MELLIYVFLLFPLVLPAILENIAFAIAVGVGRQPSSLQSNLVNFLAVWLGGAVLFAVIYRPAFLDMGVNFIELLGFSLVPLAITFYLNNRKPPFPKVSAVVCGALVATLIMPSVYWFITCTYFSYYCTL